MIEIVTIDTETTGLTPEDKIVEIGFCHVSYGGVIETPGAELAIGLPGSIITNPHRPIDVRATACHHITDDMVAKGADVDETISFALDGGDIVVAHNNRFEQQFIKTEKPWIDTYRVALFHAPHAPGHSLQVLRYWLKLAVDPVLASPPHRAAPDAYRRDDRYQFPPGASTKV